MSLKIKGLIGYSIIIAIIAMPLLGIVACSPATTTQTLKSIQLSPNPSPSLEVGLSLHFYAIGLYTDGSSQDIDNLVNWSSSNINVATVDSGGSVTAITIGTTYIMATLSGVTSPTVSLIVVPSTKPGSGNIEGKINFEDNMPGNGVTILLCKSNATGPDAGGSILKQTITDSQGNYGFNGVAVGTYWINVVVNNTYVINEPWVTIQVTSNNTTNAQTLSVNESIYVSSINGTSIGYTNPNNFTYPNITSGPSFTFSWTNLTNATNYQVKVSASNNEYNVQNGDGYNVTEQTAGNSIAWPQNVSTLPYKYFCISITAYDGNTNLASNYAIFTFSTGTTVPTSSN